eukprot:7882075-Karenia_brevis.AAC.1
MVDYKQVVAVIAMWKSSAVDGGVEARDERAWKPNNLVKVLVDKTLRRCKEMATCQRDLRNAHVLVFD